MCELEIGKNMSILLCAPADNSQQERGHIFQHDRLPDDKKNGHAGVGVAVLNLELMQPSAEKMQHQEKISDHEYGINRQLNHKSFQRFDRFRFHLNPPHIIRRRFVWRLRKTTSTSKFHCAPDVFS